MENLLSGSWNLILFLVELAIILFLVDLIGTIIGKMVGFSWKKVLLWAAAFFGILWLRDFLKKRKETAKEEVVTELTDADFEVVEDEETKVEE